MTTLADLATPYPLNADESSYARAAFDWSLRGNAQHMVDNLSKLTPAARAEVLLCTEFLAGSLAGLVKKDTALPANVEGHVIVGRRG